MRSLSYVRVENQKSVVEKVRKRKTGSAELSTSGSRQMVPVRHSHRKGCGGSKGVGKDGAQEIKTRSF